MEEQLEERRIRVRCAQLSPRIGDAEGNLEAIETELRLAVEDGVGLLVLPELATSGYALTPQEAREVALTADAPIFRRWLGLLEGSGTTAVLGFCERDPADSKAGSDSADVVYNSAVLLTAGAEPVVYRKLHLWDTEKLVFTPGSAAPPIVQTPVGAVGVVICYDIEFPELPRTLALAGAEIVAVPTNWPRRRRPEGEHPHEVVHAMAAAQASGIVIACCDRSGPERGVDWTEGTAIIGADGWPVGRLDGGHRLDAELALIPAAERRRISERNDLFGDRRPEFYRLGT